MKRDSHAPRQTPTDSNAADLSSDEALIAWDELDEQLLQMLAEDPERGRRLRKLQDADGWLRARAADAARKTGGMALLECPEAEELYDFGQGPGATTLSQARQDAIDRHLATCRECEAFVETLTNVPTPLVELGLPEEDREELPVDPAWVRPTPVIPIRRTGPRRLLVAAAAVVVAMVAIQTLSGPRLVFPEQPIFRNGRPDGPVWFPRGKILLPSDEVLKVFPALYGPLEWHVAPMPGASEYKVELTRHDDSAFGGNEAPVQPPMRATQPKGTWSGTLTAGLYTADATATVHGLPQVIGAHDFEVNEDAKVEKLLIALKGEPEPTRTLHAIDVLHVNQYWNDARNLARTLPESAKRDEYLSQIPER